MPEHNVAMLIAKLGTMRREFRKRHPTAAEMVEQAYATICDVAPSLFFICILLLHHCIVLDHIEAERGGRIAAKPQPAAHMTATRSNGILPYSYIDSIEEKSPINPSGDSVLSWSASWLPELIHARHELSSNQLPPERFAKLDISSSAMLNSTSHETEATCRASHDATSTTGIEVQTNATTMLLETVFDVQYYSRVLSWAKSSRDFYVAHSDLSSTEAIMHTLQDLLKPLSDESAALHKAIDLGGRLVRPRGKGIKLMPTV